MDAVDHNKSSDQLYNFRVPASMLMTKEGAHQFFAYPEEPMDTPVPGAGIQRLVDSKPDKLG